MKVLLIINKRLRGRRNGVDRVPTQNYDVMFLWPWQHKKVTHCIRAHAKTAERDDRVATSTHAVNHRLAAADEDIKSLANRHHRQERETPTINDPPPA